MKKLSETVWTSPAGHFTTITQAKVQYVLPEFMEKRIVHTEIHATKQ